METGMTTTPDIMTQEEVFDSIGPGYEIAFASLNTQLEAVQWLMRHIEDRKPARVLDLGCGTGRPVCSAFADKGHNVLGVDVSGVMLAYARDKVPNAKFLQADVFQMELPSQSFDAIVVFFSLSAGSSQELIRKQIQRMYQWLTWGGALVLATVPNARDQQRSKFMGRPFLGSGLSQEEYLERIEQVGFEIVYHRVSSFLPKAVEAGLCAAEENQEEPHLIIYAKKELL